jgi:hypothetical protein
MDKIRKITAVRAYSLVDLEVTTKFEHCIKGRSRKAYVIKKDSVS